MNRMSKRVGLWVRVLMAGVLLPVLVISCTTGPMNSYYSPEAEAMPVSTPVSRDASHAGSSYAPPAEQRPGLGTGWGRSVSSQMAYTPFTRASSKPHQGFSSIYYNDREGVNAMTGWKHTGSKMQSAAGGLVEWGVSSSGSSLLRNYHGSGRRFVVGKDDDSYALVVKNLAKSRLEIVLSVDGLDVMDGKTASMKKRGYLVAPGATLKVKGWRMSSQSVASFKFSGVGGSYSNLRHGQTRNVGVIGLAVFTEKGVDPWTWMPREVAERKGASPFAEAPIYGVR
jgi:hypothetical protein